MLSKGRGRRYVEAARIWPTALGLLVALAVVFNGAFVAAQSDDPFVDDESEREPLPELEVVGEAEPPVVLGDDFPFPSALEGSVFDSPPAIGYHADSATTATIIDAPLIDIPGTVDVVPSAVLYDQQALRMDDVLRDITKAVPLGNALRPDAFLKMGFEVRSRDFRKNGFLDPTSAPRDFANIERIEVLEGPASSLYGNGQPSGVVNIITKKPLEDPFQSLDFIYGMFDMRRVTLDSTGPLSFGDGKVLYRINLAYDDANGFRDFGFDHRTFIAPVVRWNLGPRTRVTWEGEYLSDRRRYDTGVVAFGGRVDALPIERFLGEPQDFIQYKDYRTTVFLDHEFSDSWKLRFGGYSQAGNNRASGTVPILNAGGSSLARQRRDIDEWQEQYHSVVANITGEFCTAGVGHKLVMGTEQGWLLEPDFTAYQSDPLFSPLVIDAASPTYGLYDPVATPMLFDSEFNQSRHGIYVSDLLEFSPHWKGLVGVRYDSVHQKFARTLDVYEFTPFPTIVRKTPRDDQDFARWSPRAGLVFQPLPDVLSAYVNYGESFDTPPGGGRIEPNPIDPEVGRIWEAGIKAKLFSDLTLTAAGFHVRKDNEVFDDVDPRTFLPTVSQLDVRSQGAELSLVGNLTEHWSIVANYAYQDVLITYDSQRPDRVGNRVRNVPLNTGNVWLRWDKPLANCQKVGASIGMIHLGPRPGDLENTFELPSYTRWDSGVYYDYRALRCAVYLENLLDDRYYTGSVTPLEVYPGLPFNVRGTVALVY
jgi:iron complex outermembrane receptor protein